MNAQYTPGPWTHYYGRAGGSSQWFIGPSCARPLVAYVGEDSEEGLTGATVEANARLIAAAPELVDAAEIAENQITGLGHDGGPTHAICGLCDAVEALRQAVARAKGRTP